MEETQHALLSTLYARNRRDAILLHCIEKRLGVNEANDLLDDDHLATLHADDEKVGRCPKTFRFRAG